MSSHKTQIRNDGFSLEGMDLLVMRRFTDYTNQNNTLQCAKSRIKDEKLVNMHPKDLPRRPHEKAEDSFADREASLKPAPSKQTISSTGNSQRCCSDGGPAQSMRTEQDPQQRGGKAEARTALSNPPNHENPTEILPLVCNGERSRSGFQETRRKVQGKLAVATRTGLGGTNSKTSNTTQHILAWSHPSHQEIFPATSNDIDQQAYCNSSPYPCRPYRDYATLQQRTLIPFSMAASCTSRRSLSFPLVRDDFGPNALYRYYFRRSSSLLYPFFSTAFILHYCCVYRFCIKCSWMRIELLAVSVTFRISFHGKFFQPISMRYTEEGN